MPGKVRILKRKRYRFALICSAVLGSKFITYVRYNRDMSVSEAVVQCAWCGGEIPPRPDPRGRKAHYCCGACRASSARERARKAHQDELKRAQEHAQDSFVLGSPEDILDTVVREIDATTRLIRDRGDVPDSCAEMVNAARKLVASADKPAPQPLTRQQRRRLAREQKKTC